MKSTSPAGVFKKLGLTFVVSVGLLIFYSFGAHATSSGDTPVRCAKAGYMLCQLQLAKHYAFGIGVPKNYEQALFWLKQRPSEDMGYGPNIQALEMITAIEDYQKTGSPKALEKLNQYRPSTQDEPTHTLREMSLGKEVTGTITDAIPFYKRAKLIQQAQNEINKNAADRVATTALAKALESGSRKEGLDWIKSNISPDLISDTESKFMSLYNNEQTAKKESQDAAFDKIMDILTAPPVMQDGVVRRKTFVDIPQDLIDAAGSENVQKARNYKQEADVDLYYDVKGRIMAGEDVDLKQYRAGLGEKYGELIEFKQNNFGKPLSSVKDTINTAVDLLGLKVSGKKKDEDDIAKAALFQDKFIERVSEYRAKYKREPSDKELIDIRDKLLMSGVGTGSGWFGGKTEKKMRAYEVEEGATFLPTIPDIDVKNAIKNYVMQNKDKILQIDPTAFNDKGYASESAISEAYGDLRDLYSDAEIKRLYGGKFAELVAETHERDIAAANARDKTVMNASVADAKKHNQIEPTESMHIAGYQIILIIFVVAFFWLYRKRWNVCAAIKSFPSIANEDEAVKLAQSGFIGGLLYACVCLFGMVMVAPFLTSPDAPPFDRAKIAIWLSAVLFATLATTWKVYKLRGNIISIIAFVLFTMNVAGGVFSGFIGSYVLLLYYFLGRMLFSGVRASWYLRKNPIIAGDRPIFEKGFLKEKYQEIKNATPRYAKKIVVLLILSCLVYALFFQFAEWGLLSKARLFVFDLSAAFLFLIVAVFSEPSSFIKKATCWSVAFVTWFLTSQIMNTFIFAPLLFTLFSFIGKETSPDITLLGEIQETLLATQYADIFATILGILVQIKAQNAIKKMRLFNKASKWSLGSVHFLLGKNDMKPHLWRGLVRTYWVLNLPWFMYFAYEFLDAGGFGYSRGEEAFLSGLSLPLGSLLFWASCVWIWRGFTPDKNVEEKHL